MGIPALDNILVYPHLSSIIFILVCIFYQHGVVLQDD
jgi:hypothetical protein